MTSQVVALKETEHEDVIFEDDYPEGTNEILDKTPVDIVSDEENDPGEKIPEKNKPDQEETEDLDTLIEKLPDSFPKALPEIRSGIAPAISQLDGGMFEYYVEKLKKQTKAPKKAILEEIEIAKKETTSEESTGEEDEEVDPEVLLLAEEIGKDPLLFKKRIDTVNKLDVVGEEKALGLYFVALDSRLIPMGLGGSEALPLKNSGHQGSGKSYPLSMCLQIYPDSCFNLISSRTGKSLLYLKEGLKHKALIITEAFSFQSNNATGSELAYVIRSLLSEGYVIYQYTGWDEDHNKVTKVKKIEGPTSLITTSIYGRLEPQLEDRMFNVHPDTSTKQTKDIISMTGDQAAGNTKHVDGKTIKAWKLFHKSLEPLGVIIPFAWDISEYVNRNEELSLAARRAFKRVMSATKAVTLSHQHQRQRDEQGRVVAQRRITQLRFS